MKKIIVLTFCLILTNSAFSKEASTSKHSHHSKQADTQLTLNDGKKWEIDQVMNENMSKIMKENTRLASLKSAKEVTTKDYNKLSELIATSAHNIVTKCKLEPKADEVFHIILADLYIVSEHLKDSKKPQHAIEKLNETLSSYQKYFNHTDSL